MQPQKQRISHSKMGDCFAACMASLLELPIEVIPNDHTERWWFVWKDFLGQFGLSASWQTADGSIWASYPWIASVKSKNYDEVNHAILMHNGGEVLFDPSTKKIYKKGEHLLGKDVVVGGYTITVSDFTLLHKLEEYRQNLVEKKKTKKKTRK